MKKKKKKNPKKRAWETFSFNDNNIVSLGHVNVLNLHIIDIVGN